MMGYYRGTVLLKRAHAAVQVEKILGVPADLNKVGQAIHGLEHFLASQQQHPCEESQWEKGMVIMPTDEQYRQASSRDKELWGQHIATEGRTPPPGVNVCASFRQEKKMLAQAKSLYGQITRHMDVAHILVNRQQAFLLSGGNWMEKVKLTILEVAEHLPEWGEKTVRDSIHSLSFNLSGKVFPADTLICASETPYVCKQVMQIKETLPNAGAPLLTNALNEQGLNVSQRMIGNSLKMIASHESRQLA